MDSLVFSLKIPQIKSSPAILLWVKLFRVQIIQKESKHDFQVLVCLAALTSLYSEALKGLKSSFVRTQRQSTIACSAQ